MTEYHPPFWRVGHHSVGRVPHIDRRTSCRIMHDVVLSFKASSFLQLIPNELIKTKIKTESGYLLRYGGNIRHDTFLDTIRIRIHDK